MQTFGNYLVYSLPTSLVNEHRLKEVTHVVRIRNMLLELLCVLVQSCGMDNDYRCSGAGLSGAVGGWVADIVLR